MTKRLLITGGAGLLGLNWAAQKRHDHSVTICRHRNIPTLAGVDVLALPLDDPESIDRSLPELRPDLVVHAAGLTNVDACEQDPETARLSNVECSRNMAAAARAVGARFVFISTDQLFDGSQPCMDETAAVAPLNVYAESKISAERAVLQEHDEALLIRTNFYGWGTRVKKSFSDHILSRLRAGDSVYLFDDVYYTPISIAQLVEAVHGLLAGGARGVFNVVGSERVTKYEFGCLLAAAFGLDASLIQRGSIARVDLKALRPRDMSLSNRKTLNHLQWDVISLETGISRLYEEESHGLAKEISTAVRLPANSATK